MRRGKRFRAAYERVDRDHHYTPAEAIALVKETASTKFDETVEVHLRLGVNVRHAEEQLRGTLALPNGLGKDVTVAVFADGDAAKAATEAGADHVGAQDLAERVSEGWTDFDVAIATPDLMGPVVSKLGRILGPQGKMPNPKVGTVTKDVGKAVSEAKAGKFDVPVGIDFKGQAAGQMTEDFDTANRQAVVILTDANGKPVKIVPATASDADLNSAIKNLH
jgi:large subunit ribosomal protein L1